LLNDLSGCTWKDNEESWLIATKMNMFKFREDLKAQKPQLADIPIYPILPFSRLTKVK